MSARDLLPQIPRDRLLIPLSEVAKLTGWSERSLRDDCTAGIIDHTNRKGTIGFRPDQIDALLRRYEVLGTGEALSAAEREANELEAARLANVASISRSRGRRVA